MIKKFLLVLLFSATYMGISHANTDKKKICSGFGKWTKDGEFKIVRSKCITEKDYLTSLKAPDYLCNYYQKSIWKESERAYGKKTV